MRFFICIRTVIVFNYTHTHTYLPLLNKHEVGKWHCIGSKAKQRYFRILYSFPFQGPTLSPNDFLFF